jgi:hypothetical protein
LSGGLFGCSTTSSRFQNGNTQTTSAGSKFIIIQPWTDKQFTVLVAGSSNPPVKSRIETITAKWAKYRATDLTEGNGEPVQFWMAAIPNPISKKICFISAQRDIYYVDKDSEMMGSESPAGGWMTCTKSYVEVPETEGGIKTAIAKFENQFDSRKLQQWQNAPPVLSANITFAAPADFFSGVNLSFPNGSIGVRIDVIDLTDGMLHIEMTSLPDKNVRFIEKHGTFLIDFKAEKVIKSMVDGQEMDLSHTNGEPFAVPLKKN